MTDTQTPTRTYESIEHPGFGKVYGTAGDRWLPVETAHLNDGPAIEYGTASGLANLRHDGWFTDEIMHETLKGVVYMLDGPDEEWPEEDARFYALAVSSDTDCHYLDPDVYEDPVEAALAADGLADRIAEQEREWHGAWRVAGRLHARLRGAHDQRRDAFAMIRHLAECGEPDDAMLEIAGRMHAEGMADQQAAWSAIAEAKPWTGSHLLDAWRDGWHI